MKNIVNYIIRVAIVVLVILSIEFLEKSISSFFLFQIDETGKTKGIIKSAILNDGIDARTYDCEFTYSVAQREYNVLEVVSVDSSHFFTRGDYVAVIYNKRKPYNGTIRHARSLITGFFASAFTIGVFCYIVFTLIRDVINLVRKIYKQGK